MGIDEPVRVALAMNRMGIPAPESFFEGRTAQLADLIEEDVVVIQEFGGGQRRIVVLHQQVAGLLYDHLVPRDRTEARAVDLAAAFCGYRDDPVSAAAVITGSRGGNGPERKIVRRMLELTWADIRERAADERQTAAVAAWLFRARAVGVELSDRPYRGELLRLLGPDTPGSIVRPLAIVAYATQRESRSELLAALEAWLAAHPEDPFWPQVAVESLRHGISASTIEPWLEGHVTTPGSAAVFLALSETSEVRAGLLGAVLDEAPPITGDRRLWREARRRGVADERLLTIVIRRARDAPTNRVVRRAAAFVAETAGDDDTELVARLLREQIDSPALARLLRAMTFAVRQHSPLADAIVAVGIDVLARSPDADDWPATWQAMYSRSGASQRVLGMLARRWLTANPTRSGWFAVANTLVRRAPGAGATDWSELFVDGNGVRDDMMCGATAKHLAADLGSFGWWRLATGLLRADSAPPYRELARRWLRANPHAQGWPLVWEALCRRRPEQQDLELGRQWLAHEQTNPKRDVVHQRLRQVARARR